VSFPWRTAVRRALKSLLVLVLAVLIATGGYVGYAAIQRGQSITLPAPTGPYRVGRAMVDWTDHSRTDPYAPRPGTARELAVWLWYPAASGRGGAPYAPGAWGQLHFGAPESVGESSFDAIRTHSTDNAPVAAGQFPVVVLEPGLGFSAPTYTTLAENVASHGFVVAGVTPTYTANLTVLRGQPVHASAAGNPSTLDTDNLHDPAATAFAEGLLQVSAADAHFAVAQVDGLDRAGLFAGHVDPGRTAYVGHSFGGATALEACRTDPRCAGAVDLDGTQYGPVVHKGLDRPMMLIASDNSCVTGTCRPANSNDTAGQAIAKSLLAASTGPVWCYQINGAQHYNFTDYGAYYLAWPLRQLLALGSIDGDTALNITDAYVAAFLDQTVHGRPQPLLTEQTRPYPEIVPQPRK